MYIDTTNTTIITTMKAPSYLLIVHILHIVIVAPLLFALTYYGPRTPQPVFPALVAIGAFVLLYHLYLAYKKFKAASPWVWVNLVHIIIVAPLLIWIGVHQQKTHPRVFQGLAVLTAVMFLYHCYQLYRDVEAVAVVRKGEK